MELTKQEKKEQKKREKEEKKRLKAEGKTPMDPAKKKKIVKRSIIGAVAGVFVLFIVVSNISKANAKPMVYTSPVTRGDIEQTINTSGAVASNEVKTYFAPVSIEIGTINVNTGETVKKGSPVLTYDETDLANEKRTAELKLQANEGSYKSSIQKNNESIGDLGEANVNLGVLEQQITDIDNHIKELQRQVDEKKAALAHEGALLQISLIDWANHPDSDEYENLQKLVQINGYEQNNNEEIRAWEEEIKTYTDMLNNCKEYKAEMKSQQTSAESTKLNAGGKEELEAKNEMENITSQETLSAIQETENGILAEFNGVVTEMNAVEGKTPAVGEQLFKLESTEDVKVSISVSKYDLEKIKEGQKAVVTIGGNTYEGEVSKIDKMATKNNSGASVVNADIKILNPDENIFLGVEAKISVSTSKSEAALLVPFSAVNTDMEGSFVYAVENGVIVKKPVQTGISSDLNMEITEGLNEGDQILTEINGNIMEGMEVSAVPMQ
ncbi:MAG: efflux RND transporter periplasmic adaptor subunit [Lachnospiraceae bacterium]|jgi:HlyD family secretion protein|nr:efflux RND transporter periplasmic adaptor subunit [Lachnospiraceae bacterium]